ncbi:hypothetical protein ACH5RR_011770 [Cinchona calisaya]|uniref:BHLH domain-containing protein n=1 Tax=Cinchona calisaya TaxID=153742 RepID=A0ABD3A5V9_9GENT
MLRCVQTSSPENFTPVAAGIDTDTSVLERQHAILLQRLYQHQQPQHLHSPPQTTMPLLFQSHQEENSHPNVGLATCSQITTNNNTTTDHHHHPSFSNISAANSFQDQHVAFASNKKRKSEFDVEEKGKKDEKHERESGEVQSGIAVKSEKENSGRNSRASEVVVQKTDYIHVRARRGQATDSHSLAERARREKISKKMKCLQDLIPGCNKVTGKAGMLDEIINYVQSLQKQVEFLSMKLATLNPRPELNIENFLNINSRICSTPIEMVHSDLVQYNQGQQESTFSGVDTADPESVSSLSQVQQMPTWDGEWQSLYNVSFQFLQS